MFYRLIFLSFLLLSQVLAKDKILIVKKASKNFKEVSSVIKQEIGSDYEIVELDIDNNTEYSKFAAEVRKVRPKMLVLLDNEAVELAKRFNKEKDDYAKNLKAVASMGVNLQKVLKGNKNICGIAYEVPAYAIITDYKFIVKSNLKNVLVFYRKSEHQELIEKTRKQLKNEGVELIAVDAEKFGKRQKDIDFFLKKNLIWQTMKKSVDAVWVLSDNVLVSKTNFSQYWLPVSKRVKKPFLSGIKAFSKDLSFCEYSVSPNHSDLGGQLAQMALSLQLT